MKIENGVVTNVAGKEVASVRLDTDKWIIVRTKDGREASFNPANPQLQELINRFIWEGLNHERS